MVCSRAVYEYVPADSPGTPVTEEGQQGDRMYVLVHGSCTMLPRHSVGPHEDALGERAQFGTARRRASACPIAACPQLAAGPPHMTPPRAALLPGPAIRKPHSLSPRAVLLPGSAFGEQALLPSRRPYSRTVLAAALPPPPPPAADVATGPEPVASGAHLLVLDRAAASHLRFVSRADQVGALRLAVPTCRRTVAGTSQARHEASSLAGRLRTAHGGSTGRSAR